MTKFTKKDILNLEQVLKHIKNNERVKALIIFRDIPFFKEDISWVKGLMIQDMDAKDKGGNRNDTELYMIDAIKWAKDHYKDQQGD